MAIKLCLDNEKQIETTTKIVRDVVNKKIKNPKAVVKYELEKAIKYYNSNDEIKLPAIASLGDYVTSIFEIHKAGGKCKTEYKRRTGPQVVIENVYRMVYGEEIIYEQNGTQVENQISVEQLCPMETAPVQDLPEAQDDMTPEELEQNEVEDSWSDTNPPEVIKMSDLTSTEKLVAIKLAIETLGEIMSIYMSAQNLMYVREALMLRFNLKYAQAEIVIRIARMAFESQAEKKMEEAEEAKKWASLS